MQHFIIIFTILSLLSCKKKEDIKTGTDNTIAQNISVLVKPNETDVNYASEEESHYVVRSNKTHLNKLLLFIGGSYSIPKNYNLVCDHAASIGLDVISISYPNNVATASLGTSSDKFIFDNYRDEICFGNQVSNVVSVDDLNSINTRTTKLIIHLKKAFPKQNWDQYLTTSNTLKWEKIVISGHSQGSGHACYLGKKRMAERVVMFSGPNDFSSFYNEAGNWLKSSGLTPLNKHFALLHSKDEIVSFPNQISNLRGMGMLTATGDPLLVDDLSAPFNNAQTFSLSIPALSFHNSSVGANQILPAVWTYLFTAK